MLETQQFLKRQEGITFLCLTCQEIEWRAAGTRSWLPSAVVIKRHKQNLPKAYKRGNFFRWGGNRQLSSILLGAPPYNCGKIKLCTVLHKFRSLLSSLNSSHFTRGIVHIGQRDGRVDGTLMFGFGLGILVCTQCLNCLITLTALESVWVAFTLLIRMWFTCKNTLSTL